MDGERALQKKRERCRAGTSQEGGDFKVSCSSLLEPDELE